MNNLIICPVGNPISFHDKFDKENHWRYTKEHRLYETLVFQYSDFQPEIQSCDESIKEKGLKWFLVKKWIKTFDLSKYEYIGFFDDDIVTDIDNLNKALTIAKENDLKIFQMSVTSDSDVFYPILRNKEGIKYTKTNFVEVMAPVIHVSLIPLCIELWEKYDIYTGWGFDKVLTDLTKTDAAVIHECQMYHPLKISSYEKTSAFEEMNTLLYNVFPKFVKDKYNEDWSFKESQIEKEIIMETV